MNVNHLECLQELIEIIQKYNNGKVPPKKYFTNKKVEFKTKYDETDDIDKIIKFSAYVEIYTLCEKQPRKNIKEFIEKLYRNCIRESISTELNTVFERSKNHFIDKLCEIEVGMDCENELDEKEYNTKSLVNCEIDSDDSSDDYKSSAELLKSAQDKLKNAGIPIKNDVEIIETKPEKHRYNTRSRKRQATKEIENDENKKKVEPVVNESVSVLEEGSKKDAIIYAEIFDKQIKLDKEYDQIMIFENEYNRNKNYFQSKSIDEKEDLLKKLKELKESNKVGYLFDVLNSKASLHNKKGLYTMYCNMNEASSGGDYGKLSEQFKRALKLPLGVYCSIDNSNPRNIINKARKSLNDTVEGNDYAKTKVLQLLAKELVNKSRNNDKIIAFHGYPGTGKTTMIKNGLAKILNRPVVFIPVAGITSNEDLVGHGSTYTGSIYGRIARALMDAKCMNPIIIFDEIDKMSGYRNVAQTFMQILDYTQNDSFEDRYFEHLKLDLSQCIFICTLNSPKELHPVLRDRLDLVEVPSIVPHRKLDIIKNYMIPDIIKKNNYDFKVDISDETIMKIIHTYTMEAGVRSIKRIINEVYEYVNLHRIETGSKEKTINIDYDIIHHKILKEQQTIHQDKINDKPKIGHVNGLVWCSTGIGGIIKLQTSTYPTDKKFETRETGNISKVSTESCQHAYSVAFNLLTKKQKQDMLNKWKEQGYCDGIIIKFGDGGGPVDGPSAGIAMAVAIYSQLTGQYVDNKVAMTGEIDLDGPAKIIGGLEQKLLGAREAGVTKVLYPREMEHIYKKVINKIRFVLDDMEIVPIDNIHDAIRHTIISEPKASAEASLLARAEAGGSCQTRKVKPIKINVRRVTRKRTRN